jgi:hypothetical protein
MALKDITDKTVSAKMLQAKNSYSLTYLRTLRIGDGVRLAEKSGEVDDEYSRDNLRTYIVNTGKAVAYIGSDFGDNLNCDISEKAHCFRAFVVKSTPKHAKGTIRIRCCRKHRGNTQRDSTLSERRTSAKAKNNASHQGKKNNLR